jgi:hypothetical protein
MKTKLTSEDLYPYASTKNVAVRICRNQRWFIGKLNYADLDSEILTIRLSALQEIIPPTEASNSVEVVPEYHDDWKRLFWHDSPPFQPFNNPYKNTDGDSSTTIRIECDDGIITMSLESDDIIAMEKLLSGKPH